jgi:hypothetical protein
MLTLFFTLQETKLSPFVQVNYRGEPPRREGRTVPSFLPPPTLPPPTLPPYQSSTTTAVGLRLPPLTTAVPSHYLEITPGMPDFSKEVGQVFLFCEDILNHQNLKLQRIFSWPFQRLHNILCTYDRDLDNHMGNVKRLIEIAKIAKGFEVSKVSCGCKKDINNSTGTNLKG